MNADPWKNRSKGMKCRTCMYFVPKEANATPQEQVEAERQLPDVLGRCRRHAPTLNGYPAVWDYDWCGDHKLDENRVE